jgi:nitrogen-specific signal transduction histidine kinase
LEQDRSGRQAEKKADHPSGESGSHTFVGKIHNQEEIISFPASLWVELISTTKSTLFSIKSVSQLSVDKFNDPEFRKYARKSIAQDIKKIDSVLNSLLNYIQINTPIVKSNTIHLLLEEILGANEKCLSDKHIKIIKHFQKDLPETFLHDEEVKFLLNSIVQYALFSTPPHGSIGFLTRIVEAQRMEGGDKVISLTGRKQIDILVAFTDHEEPFKATDRAPSEGKGVPRDKVHQLILLLIKEIIKKYKGLIEFDIDERDSRTVVSLRLPLDRRQVVYYEQLNL